MSVDFPDAGPMPSFEWNAYEAPFVIGGDVEDEAVDAVEIEDVDPFAFVEPHGRVILRLQRRHDHVDVVIAQTQHGFVRIDEIVRRKTSADFVELRARERVSVLEEIVERVQGAHLQRLTLVIHAATYAAAAAAAGHVLMIMVVIHF